MKIIVEKIRKFVEKESKKPEAWWGDEFYDLHLVKVAKYAKMLAKKLGADSEIAELAAWMHDIGSSIYGRKDHHITGAEVAEKKLRELEYPEDRIEKVKHCILAHRGSQLIEPETIEAKIVADADALAAFDHIHGPFMAAFVYEKRSQSDARDSVRQKYVNSWHKLNFQESKNIIQPKFEAIKLLLE
ncbi:MAG: HD domain-containing protein [archaeon]